MDMFITGLVGILGTAVGTVIGVVVDQFIQRKGRIHFLTNDWTMKYIGPRNHLGEDTETDDPKVARYGKLSFRFKAFNNADFPTEIHGFKLIILGNGGTRPFECTVNTSDERGVSFINLPAREMVAGYVFCHTLKVEDVAFVRDGANVYLEVESLTGLKKRKRFLVNRN